MAAPEQDDERIRAATGRRWDEWVALIQAGPGRDGHTAIATWLRDAQGVDPWWAQAVTVGFERIVGIRLPGQMPDGTFSITRSRTVAQDAEELRTRWEDDVSRAALLAGMSTERRSRAGVKLPRFALTAEGTDAGLVSLLVEPVQSGARLTITHEKLPDPESAERWKAFWGDWLEGISKKP